MSNCCEKEKRQNQNKRSPYIIDEQFFKRKSIRKMQPSILIVTAELRKPIWLLNY